MIYLHIKLHTSVFNSLLLTSKAKILHSSILMLLHPTGWPKTYVSHKIGFFSKRKITYNHVYKYISAITLKQFSAVLIICPWEHYYEFYYSPSPCYIISQDIIHNFGNIDKRQWCGFYPRIEFVSISYYRKLKHKEI